MRNRRYLCHTLSDILAEGGEGLMLHAPGTGCVVERSKGLVKLKARLF